MLYDSVFLAADEVMAKEQGRRALILLTDGDDRGSKVSLARAIEAAQRANTLVYAIYYKGERPSDHGGGPGGGHGGFPGGGGRGGGHPLVSEFGQMGGGRGGGGGYGRDQVDGKKILERMCGETGGRVFEVKKKETLEVIYGEIAEELRTQYRLGFTPSLDARADGYHKVLVQMTGAAVKAKAGGAKLAMGITWVSKFYDGGMAYTVAAFYKFTALPDPAALRDAFAAAFAEDELWGTILFAEEGVNGTVAADAAVIARVVGMLVERVGLDAAEVKYSAAEERPFGRLKLKVKQEVLAFRQAVVDTSRAGTYVEAREWNALMRDPEVLLLDTRNDYEVAAGTFAGAVDPGITTFSEFVAYARENLDPSKQKKVAMFCTGGIRCEKASAFLLQEGFGEVFHLKGGILKYLEEVPEAESLWEGDCFVFDRRRGVGHEDFEG